MDCNTSRIKWQRATKDIVQYLLHKRQGKIWMIIPICTCSSKAKRIYVIATLCPPVRPCVMTWCGIARKLKFYPSSPLVARQSEKCKNHHPMWSQNQRQTENSENCKSNSALRQIGIHSLDYFLFAEQKSLTNQLFNFDITVM